MFKNRVKNRTPLYSHMHVFYQTQLSSPQITLTEDESKHCVRVLRMQKGDEVYLADGLGTMAKAVIADDHPKKCVLQIVSRTEYTQAQSSGRNYYLHLLVAPTKNFDRMEWFIEKATEVGVDEITFIETENSERAKVNLERCLKIAVSAMKQSKQWYLPKINALVGFDAAIKAVGQTAKFMCWCPTAQTDLLCDLMPQAQSNQLAILIGPEGDFTPHEVQLAQAQGFVPASLGQTILRTETAALFACMAAKSTLS